MSGLSSASSQGLAAFSSSLRAGGGREAMEMVSVRPSETREFTAFVYVPGSGAIAHPKT